MASIFDGDAFKLADLDFLGDEAELRARAREELLAAGGAAEPREREEGTDGTGAVRVSLGRDGQVHAVEVSRNWQERLTPGEFAGALYAAYQAAQAKHVNAAALHHFATGYAAQEHTAPGEAAAPRMPGDNADERAWLGEIWGILSGNDDALHRIARGEGLAASEARTVSGPHGFLNAQIEGGGIAGIGGNADLIRSAGAGQLETEAVAVLRAAGATREGTANGG
jgi:hypothetical protein